MEVAAVPTERPPKRTRRQFGLGSLMLGIAAIALVLGVLTYYRSHSLTVAYYFAAVDSTAVSPILDRQSATAIEGSTYVWIVVNDDDLAAMMLLDGKPAQAMGAKSRVVSVWPHVAEATTYSRDLQVPVDVNTGQVITIWETGQFAGTFGSHRAGLRPQFRIEGRVAHQRPDTKARATFPYPQQTCNGRLYYEGAAPQGHLVFLAPIDQTTYHAVIFNAR